MAITDLIWLRVCAHVCACMRECVVSTQLKALAKSIKQMFFWNSLAFLMIQRMLAI